jgi:hypothetical protein
MKTIASLCMVNLLSELSATEHLVLRTIADLVTGFVAREKDYLFNQDQLEETITTGKVTKRQIVNWFAEELEKYFPDETSRSSAVD